MDLANNIELFGTLFNGKVDRRFRGATPIHGRRLALSGEIW
jgi:hypothetical protein